MIGAKIEGEKSTSWSTSLSGAQSADGELMVVTEDQDGPDDARTTSPRGDVQGFAAADGSGIGINASGGRYAQRHRPPKGGS